MSTKKDEAPQRADRNVAEAVKNEPKFAIEKLRDKSVQLFGVSQMYI